MDDVPKLPPRNPLYPERSEKVVMSKPIKDRIAKKFVRCAKAMFAIAAEANEIARLRTGL
jgi:hypothetical protein